MSEVFFTHVLAGVYKWPTPVSVALDLLRFVAHASLCVICWYTLTLHDTSPTPLNYYMCSNSTFQVALILAWFCYRKFNVMIPLFCLEILSSATTISWILISGSAETLPLAFSVYGYWTLFWWTYSLAIHNIMVGSILSILIIHRIEVRDSSSSEGSAAEEGDMEKYTMISKFVRAAAASATGTETCPICLVEYETGEELRTLPCKHYFHSECIDKWLEKRSRCPMCRQRPADVAAAEAPASEALRQTTEKENEVHVENSHASSRASRTRQRQRRRKRRRRHRRESS